MAPLQISPAQHWELSYSRLPGVLLILRILGREPGWKLLSETKRELKRPSLQSHRLQPATGLVPRSSSRAIRVMVLQLTDDSRLGGLAEQAGKKLYIWAPQPPSSRNRLHAPAPGPCQWHFTLAGILAMYLPWFGPGPGLGHGVRVASAGRGNLPWWWKSNTNTAEARQQMLNHLLVTNHWRGRNPGCSQP